jgi:hypothetical protein
MLLFYDTLATYAWLNCVGKYNTKLQSPTSQFIFVSTQAFFSSNACYDEREHPTPCQGALAAPLEALAE